MSDIVEKVRLDKWLWAARFFRTRSLAKAAIEGGKVQVDNQRAKPSREISLGSTLEIRQGWDLKTVLVTGLSDQRRGATEAAQLYRETEQSLARRQDQAARRKALNMNSPHLDRRPTKKERRQIHRFKEENL